MWEQRLNELNEDDREKVVKLHDTGLTLLAIAKRFGVTTTTVWRILQDAGRQRKPGGFGVRIGHHEL